MRGNSSETIGGTPKVVVSPGKSGKVAGVKAAARPTQENLRGNSFKAPCVSQFTEPRAAGFPTNVVAASPFSMGMPLSEQTQPPVSPLKTQMETMVVDPGFVKAQSSHHGNPRVQPSRLSPEPLEGQAARSSPASACRAAMHNGSSSSSASSSPKVFPEQLVTQDTGGGLGDHAQFLCKICNLVVRSPSILPCAHMFCSECFDQWVQRHRPNVGCPTCGQAVRPREVKHFEERTLSGGALALLYRLYSGMKVRCLYHSELLGGKPLTAEADRARALDLRCSWRGALHDHANHLKTCPAHLAVLASTASGGAPQSPASSKVMDVAVPQMVAPAVATAVSLSSAVPAPGAHILSSQPF